MKTYTLKAREITHDWHVVDASSRTLGRLAVEVAGLLRGKHKPTFSPHLDMGDYVVVVNAAKVRVTGHKRQQKMYYRHSMYPGGMKVESLEKLLSRRPARVIELAVKGMLPHNRLGRALYRHLKVYAGPNHPHEAQVRDTEKRRQAGQPPPQADQPVVEDAQAEKPAAAEAPET